jgi:hypothetical protein
MRVGIRRRIKYLEAIHGFINQSPDDDAISKTESQYAKVATPKDLISRFEEVYEGNLS